MCRWLKQLAKWLGFGKSKRYQQEQEALLDIVDPKLKLVPNYTRKLDKPISKAMLVCENAVKCLPEPLDLSPEGYAKNKAIAALFASSQDLIGFLTQSPAIRDYFGHASHPDQLYALLEMQIKEQTRFGSEINDHGMVMDDVAQTVISFSQHQVMDTMSDFYALKQSASGYFFQALSGMIAERIKSMQSQLTALTHEKQQLNLGLSTQRTSIVVGGSGEQALLNASPIELKKRLQQVETAIGQLEKVADLDGRLDLVLTMLNHAERLLSPYGESLCLSHLGVVVRSVENDKNINSSVGLLNFVKFGEEPSTQKIILPILVTRAAIQKWRNRLL